MKKFRNFFVMVLVYLSSHSCGKIISGRTSDGKSLEAAAQDDPSLASTSSGTCSGGLKRIFVTASAYNGNLGGVTGADACCMRDGNKPAGTSTYKAMIVDGASRVACTTAFCTGGTAEHVDWVLATTTPYYRTDCTTLINTTSTKGLLSFGLTNTISATNAGVWTGMSNGWVASNVCSSWASAAAGSNGDLGYTSYTNGGAINVGGTTSPDTCDNSFHLYCVEQ